MTEKIIDLEDYKTSLKPHITQELICINCKHRYIGVYPEDLFMCRLQCPKCKKTGFIIGTGQQINSSQETEPLRIG